MQPSWEKRMLEDQQRTNELLDEIGYSEGQRQLDEMVFGDAAFEDNSARRPLPTKTHSLLGSPYRTGYGGHVYAFFYYALGVLGLALVAFVFRACVHASAGPTAPAVTRNSTPPAAAQSGSP
jgi:hypothetical protein